MRLSSIVTIAATFLVAAILCGVAASFAVTVIEDNSEAGVNRALEENGLSWARVSADGLQIYMGGTAPSEAARFKALSTAGTVIDAARVIDQMLVEDTTAMAPPRFSIEILRNDSGVSLIGLVPASTDRDKITANIARATDNAPLSDFLEVADYPEPDSWANAVTFAIDSLKQLPRTKISVDADRVAISAMADSAEGKRTLETALARMAPKDLRLAIDISAPRPVITPFTLRFLIEEGRARFDACSADTEEARNQILSAATKAGFEGKANCVIGLGVPTPQWGSAAAQAISAVHDLGGGSVTISDADISLIAPEGTPQTQFDNVAGRLETDLPEVFALHAVLPEVKDATDQGPPEFVTTLSPEGLVQVRGRVDSDLSRQAVDSFAKARFGSDRVHTTARVAEDLPQGWALRVLTGIEALANLSNGAVTVTPDTITVNGNTGFQTASADIAKFLSDKLGETAHFSIDVTYQKKLDPILGLPTPDECEAQIAEILQTRKINFEPGSATIDADGAAIMDDIAEVLKKCGDIPMEIAGYTDSQGREAMNQQLSQSRAQAVLDELRARRVLTGSFTATGFGESDPIATNETEEGREANRRIEFRLIRPEPVQDQETTLEAIADSSAEETTDEDTETDEPQDETTNEQN